MKKCMSLLLTVALCLGLAIPAAADGPTFTDVPATHWAYASIERAASEKWVYGVGNDLFNPNGTVTNGQIITMLVRAFYDKEFEKSVIRTGDTSPFTYFTVARHAGVLKGTTVEHSTWDRYSRIADLNLSNSRFDMAQMMSNILDTYDYKVSESQKKEAQNQIKDWGSIPQNYQTAVASVYALGVISGQADGTFGGNNTLTRAQAATILCRLDDAVKNSPASGTGPIVEPEITPEPESTPVPTPETTVDVQALIDGVVELANEERAKEGLPALQTDEKLSNAAQIRAGEMIDLFSHTRPNGDEFHSVLKEVKVDLAYTYAGENIAAGATTPEAVMSMWMNSPGHRSNILNKTFAYIGVGYTDGYWVQIFVG